ncbi:glycoside hydrolase family protein [Agrilutibacter solisilvae]|uniref:Exo-alpha-sialidase n=1 Tax=Agrilutibacter solisilvae TaxID=2763317 RepID=A0A975ARP8_9GAMM|nr:hypothetical protein [Lysobacter solisilvae]QSX77453.1 hypothetical protein I8J32_011880 [Lysobacter solisilvae]
MPTCLPLGERLWRIWFAARDSDGRAGVLCADVDPRDAMRVLAVREVPGLERGNEGAFDSAGLWVSAALAVDGRVMLWYTGMRLGRDVPHELAIGLAVSEDGGLSFRKASHTPVLTSPAGHPRFVTAPCVRRTDSGFSMWYANGLGWRRVAGRTEPFYDLRVAHSTDGASWHTQCDPVVSIEGTAWAGVTRPWIEGEGQDATLWFSARGASEFRGPSADAYRLYRSPLNGPTVRPEDIAPVRFAPSPQPGDWDDWMQVAACVVRDGNSRVMFYNGNDFSRAGFGYAVEERDEP